MAALARLRSPGRSPWRQPQRMTVRSVMHCDGGLGSHVRTCSSIALQTPSRARPQNVRGIGRADVAVVGAGIVGACVAAALAARSEDVMLLERSPDREAAGSSRGTARFRQRGWRCRCWEAAP